MHYPARPYGTPKQASSHKVQESVCVVNRGGGGCLHSGNLETAARASGTAPNHPVSGEGVVCSTPVDLVLVIGARFSNKPRTRRETERLHRADRCRARKPLG